MRMLRQAGAGRLSSGSGSLFFDGELSSTQFKAMEELVKVGG